ncbi:MAG: crossover junction endodeoxyribonuclease RuvC [Spirochaetota bacterium]|nr:crossover junction endodeoxyribonuclease RuvC [Spirochaetota bacterium]
MRILGIDPGFGSIGWAIVEYPLSIVDFDVIETDKLKQFDDRLLETHNSLIHIINKFNPDCIAIERLFFSKNTKTAIDVAKCIGAILLTAKLSGLTYTEYTPSQIKQAIAGYGRATKNQMKKMIMNIFKIDELTGPDDASDALAIAVCHSLNLVNYRKINEKKV